MAVTTSRFHQFSRSTLLVCIFATFLVACSDRNEEVQRMYTQAVLLLDKAETNSTLDIESTLSDSREASLLISVIKSEYSDTKIGFEVIKTNTIGRHNISVFEGGLKNLENHYQAIANPFVLLEQRLVSEELSTTKYRRLTIHLAKAYGELQDWASFKRIIDDKKVQVDRPLWGAVQILSTNYFSNSYTESVFDSIYNYNELDAKMLGHLGLGYVHAGKPVPKSLLNTLGSDNYHTEKIALAHIKKHSDKYELYCEQLLSAESVDYDGIVECVEKLGSTIPLQAFVTSQIAKIDSATLKPPYFREHLDLAHLAEINFIISDPQLGIKIREMLTALRKKTEQSNYSDSSLDIIQNLDWATLIYLAYAGPGVTPLENIEKFDLANWAERTTLYFFYVEGALKKVQAYDVLRYVQSLAKLNPYPLLDAYEGDYLRSLEVLTTLEAKHSLAPWVTVTKLYLQSQKFRSPEYIRLSNVILSRYFESVGKG